MAIPDGRQARLPGQDLPTTSDDPVLVALDQAETSYRAIRATTESRLAELVEMRERLASAEEANRVLGQQLDQTRSQLERHRHESEQHRTQAEQHRGESEQHRAQVGKLRLEAEQHRGEAERQRERAQQVAAMLKEIHRSIFSGNVHDLILKACLTLTGATRGIYVTARGGDRVLRVRAASDLDGYPMAPPSEFVQALCAKVLDEHQTYVCNSEDDRADLPEPTRPEERFHNLIVAPVVLLKDFDGILIVADKLHGDFDENDVETLLNVGDQAAVAAENSRLRLDLQRAYIATITALADAVEAKDPYTRGHCERVSRYARLIAEQMSLPDYERSVVFYGGLLHDVGKIGVSDGILNKPGLLLPEERELVRSHVRVGFDMVQKVPALDTVAVVVLRHHEWYDGSGYPDGLRSDEIPLIARIVSVADAYSAMIDKRSYKEAFSREQARDELVRCAGSQFDPRVVETFLAVLDGPEVDYVDEDAEFSILLGFDPAQAGARVALG